MARQSQARSTRHTPSRGRQPKNEKTRDDDQVPDIYKEMLDEAEARDPAQFHTDRSVKRRRVGSMKATLVNPPHLRDPNKVPHKGPVQQSETFYDSTSSDESDVEWEDVEVPQPAAGQSNAALAMQGDEKTLEITIGQESAPPKKVIRRRKPVTAAEKRVRLAIHKTHLLCLLSHVSLRNRWCSDDGLHVRYFPLRFIHVVLTIAKKFLKLLLPKRIMALLHPDEGKPQFTRSTTFVDGLNQAAEIFNRRFRVTKPGLQRAHWAENQEQLKGKVVCCWPASILSNALC